MSVTMKPAVAADVQSELEVPDDEWRSIVLEAAQAAGAQASQAEAATGGGAADGPAAGRASEALLGGALLRGHRVFKSWGEADPDPGVLRMTCQAGCFSMHDEAHSSFPPERACRFGAYNAARAGMTATLTPESRGSAGAGRITAKLFVPVAFENTLQRVWRLAVPGSDMRIDRTRPHFAVVGVRGVISLTVVGAADSALQARSDIIRRSLSAHDPSHVRGFGPVKGVHVLEIDVPDLDPTRDLTVRVDVSLVSLVAGDLGNYREGAPFYAGIDFGGNGAVRLPHACMSAFEVPLTPLIDNDPISVTEIAFVESSNEYDE